MRERERERYLNEGSCSLEDTLLLISLVFSLDSLLPCLFLLLLTPPLDHQPPWHPQWWQGVQLSLWNSE